MNLVARPSILGKTKKRIFLASFLLTLLLSHNSIKLTTEIPANMQLSSMPIAEKRGRDEEEDEDDDASSTSSGETTESDTSSEEEDDELPSPPTQKLPPASPTKPPAKRQKRTVEELADVFVNGSEYQALRNFLHDREVFAVFSATERTELPYLYAMKSYLNSMVTGITAQIESERKRLINPASEVKCKKVGRATVTSLKKISAAHASLLKTLRS